MPDSMTNRKPYKNGVIIVDFDDCISIADWRDQLLPDYDAYHALSVFDQPNHWMIDTMNSMYDAGVIVVILTARPQKHLVISGDWLRSNGVKYAWMHMRNDEDFRPSPVYKLEHVQTYYKEEIRMIFDDRIDVIDRFDQMGYPTFRVEARA